MRKIQPVNNNVLIKVEEGEEKTHGGIIIPETAREKPKEGEIVAIASGATEELSIGERVIYNESAGTEIEFEGVRYILLPVSDILAKYVEVDTI